MKLTHSFAWVLSFAFASLAARVAAADDTTEKPAARIDVAASAGAVDYERSAQSPNTNAGGFVSGLVRMQPDGSPHGIFSTVGTGGAVFGPSVTTVDGGYSARVLGSSKLTGITSALFVEVGPAFGWVRGSSYSHATFGGHVGVVADLHVWNFLLGIEGTYRGGVPLADVPDQWEGAASVGLHLGVTFDVQNRRPPRN